tara:strand:+ start:117 stop:566 length:450 start_codon:yes stop_codon:yes gene_type:complete
MILLSIYPDHVKSIIDGIKKYEFRKISLMKKASKQKFIIVYETKPINSIRLVLKIGEVVKDKVNNLWNNFGENSGISKEYFFNYYGATRRIPSGRGIAIEIKDIIKLKRPISLESIRKDYPNFSPPQNLYIISEEKYPQIYRKIKSQIN